MIAMEHVEVQIEFRSYINLEVVLFGFFQFFFKVFFFFL